MIQDRGFASVEDLEDTIEIMRPSTPLPDKTLTTSLSLNRRMPTNVCAVIPAYNEAATIGPVVRATRQYLDHVFVVDNGSSDDTAEIARRNGAEVISYCEKKGYGASQHAGQCFALDRGFDYILQLDGDGQHDPAYIPLLLETALSGNYDLVLGSRFMGNSHEKFSVTRQLGIHFFSIAVSCLGMARVTDVTSGFKVYKATSLRLLSEPSHRYPAVQQMVELQKKGMRIKEVPVDMALRTAGKSHLSLPKFAIYPFLVIWLILKTCWVK